MSYARQQHLRDQRAARVSQTLPGAPEPLVKLWRISSLDQPPQATTATNTGWIDKDGYQVLHGSTHFDSYIAAMNRLRKDLVGHLAAAKLLAEL